jgi:hypothetical protein
MGQSTWSVASAGTTNTGGSASPVPTGYSLSDQHVLSPINPKFGTWFCQIYKNCSDIQNLCFEFQNILFESKYIWQNQSLYFGLIGDRNMLIWQRTTCTDMSDIAKTPKERLGPILEGALHQAAKLHLKAGRASKAINRYIKFSYF